MQYCENSTLRRAIDMGLSENMERVWRYFRGITEGLLYIHEQVSTGVVFMLVDCKQIVPLNSSSCGDPVRSCAVDRTLKPSY